MAWTVDRSFDEFHTTINLAGDHRDLANRRKDWIVNQLKGRLTVLDAFAMGSIPRFTALSGYADLDILVALHYGQHIKDKKPSTVLSNLKAALGPGAGAVRRNGQAVTVKFQSWPNVDVVPACRITNDGTVTGYEIPDMNREVWLDTNPPAHAKRIAAAAQARGPQFRKIIKMIKDWNRRQSPRLQSYHIEAVAVNGDWSWTDYSWAVYKFFEKLHNSLSFEWYDGENIAGYLDWSARQSLGTALQATTSTASSAWYATTGSNSDHQRAITLWKSIFGQRFPSYG